MVRLDVAAAVDVEVTLDYTGSATVGDDYIPSNTTVTIPAGSLLSIVELTIADDTIYENPDETINIAITNVTGASPAATQQFVNLTIQDNDPLPEVNLTPNLTSIAEGGGVATLTATLSNPSSQNVSIDFLLTGTAGETADYTVNAKNIIITAGQVTGDIIITAVQDAIDEGAGETVIVDVDTVTGATEPTAQQATVTITDDDAADFHSISNIRKHNRRFRPSYLYCGFRYTTNI